MKRPKILGGVVATAAVLLIGTAASSTVANAAPAPAVPTVTTLPLFGVQLTVEVTTGPGGALASVSVNPADGYTAIKVKPNKVAFVNEEGTAKVVVGNKHGGQRVTAKAGSLGEISGPGSWSGDVFGTGTATTVSFTIGATAEGGPDITGVSSSDPTAVVGATEYGTGDKHGHDGSKATARVTFTNGGQTRALTIRASVGTHDDGTTRAKLSVSLGKVRGVVQPVADAVGVKTWTGQLCDASEAMITYIVNEDGTLSDVSASPTDASVSVDGGKASVKFATGERVKIKARLDDDGIKVSVKEKIRCRDAADPTVNTPIDEGDDDGDHKDDDHRKDRKDKDKDKDRKDRDRDDDRGGRDRDDD